MVELKDIVKRYGDHTAVDHLTFTMEKGKIYGFLGPNGAGKSTTMNIMTGYIAASSGTVSIEGLDIVKEPEEAKKHIGYLPEIPPLYQDMTVLEFLKFVAELKLVPKNERRDQISRVLALTALGEYQSRLIRNLSKGYKQRVGLAQALIGFPDVIILDEPTVGLDPLQILEMREIIRSLREDHIVMLSSHILSEVNEVCDEVMIISHGKLVAQGTPDELEHMVGKTITMNITVIGDRDAVSNALADIEQIKSIETTEDAGSVTAKVEIDAGESTENEIRAVLAKALATAGLPVMSISAQSHSLEEVFLELTTADAEAAADDGSSPEEAGTPEADETEHKEEASDAEAAPEEEQADPESAAEEETQSADIEEETDLPSDEENGEVMS